MKTIKKWIMEVCMSMALLTALTGCSQTTEAQQQTQEEIRTETDNQAPQEVSKEQEDEQKEEEKTSREPEQADEQSNESEKPEQADGQLNESENEQTEPRKITPSEGTEYLGGKVHSVEDDGMVLAQTTVRGVDERDIILVDEQEAKKIPVKFTEDTKVEHWTIEGGGADIDMKEAALSDLQAGLGVELEGFYEGDNFVATRILIEVYK
ncbi:MAG: hypothetical protein HFI62_12355 [Lachnospiraceae bacterium]|nr:hypothetical protein [Lachnospiraceae bacterium]